MQIINTPQEILIVILLLMIVLILGHPICLLLSIVLIITTINETLVLPILLLTMLLVLIITLSSRTHQDKFKVKVCQQDDFSIPLGLRLIPHTTLVLVAGLVVRLVVVLIISMVIVVLLVINILKTLLLLPLLQVLITIITIITTTNHSTQQAPIVINIHHKTPHQLQNLPPSNLIIMIPLLLLLLPSLLHPGYCQHEKHVLFRRVIHLCPL